MKQAWILPAAMCVVVLSAPFAHALPQLALGEAAGSAGGTAVLTLSITGAEDNAGVNAKIVLPPGVTLGSVSRGPLLGASFEVVHGPFAEKETSGFIVVAYSAIEELLATDGVLLRFNLDIGSGVEDGQYPITFAESKAVTVNSRYALSNAEGTVSLAMAAPQNGMLTVGGVNLDADGDGVPDLWESERYGSAGASDGTDDYDGDGLNDATEFAGGTNPDVFVGDTSGDKRLSGADATRILQHLAQLRDLTPMMDVADVSGDGQISGADATRILQVLAGLRTQASIQR